MSYETSSESGLSSFDQAYVGGASLASDISSCILCPRGFVCESGTGTLNETHYCPGGHYCPLGSGKAIKCPPGYFCEGTKEGPYEEQTICPEGYYCPMGTEFPLRCDAGTVCDEGSASPAQKGLTREDCEPGTYLNVDECFPCEPGHVCDLHTS